MCALADKAPPLTPDQLDGCACVVCGDSRRPECVVDPFTVRQWIADARNLGL